MPQGAINKWRFYSESEGAVAGRVEGLHRRRLPTALAGLQASARVKICCLLEKLPALRLLLQEVREHILVRAGSGGTGTIRLCSTPAEEGGAGKVYRIRSGLFSDVDAGLASGGP